MQCVRIVVIVEELVVDYHWASGVVEAVRMTSNTTDIATNWMTNHTPCHCGMAQCSVACA